MQEKKGKYKKKLTDREKVNKMKQQNAIMLQEVKNSKSRAEEQMRKEYAKYQAALEQNDYKRANEALKMWEFTRKLNELAVRFVQLLERVETFQDMFNILSATNESFGNLMNMNNNRMFGQMKKNLRIFRRKLRAYEKQMDELIVWMDTLFDEKPNFFVRLIKKIKKEPEKTPEDILRENQAKYANELNAYAASLGSEPTVKPATGGASGAGASGSTATKPSTGSLVGGVDDPDVY